MKKNILKKASVRWLAEIVKIFKGAITRLVILNFIIAILSVLMATRSKSLIDIVIKQDRSRMTSEATIYVMMIIFIIVLRYVSGILDESTEYRIRVSIQNNFIKKINKSSYEKIQAIHSGKLNTYLYSDIPYISKALVTIVPQTINMATRLITALVLLFVLDKQLASIIVFLGALLVVGMSTVRKKSQKLYRDIQERVGNTRSFIQDYLSNLLVIQVFGAYMPMNKKLEELQKLEFDATMKRKYFSGFGTVGFSLIYEFGFLCMIFWGAYQISQSNLTLGSLVALTQISGQIQGPIANLTGMIPYSFGVLESINRIIQVERLEEKASKKYLKKDLAAFKRIDVRGLNYAYDGQKVLDEVILSINSGDKVSLMGTSGSGKTTLLMLLMGIYKSENQSIKIAFSDSHEVLPEELPENFYGYVPQSNQIFAGTIKENISFFNSKISQKEIEHAARVACANEFIESLKDGYDTNLTEGGKSISLGQAQRIAIARAICSRPSVLILDEATSALDSDTEMKILKQLSDMSITCLMVTHRKSTLKISNKKLNLTRGKIYYE
ncbi:ABC transporter ATP-binding protein [Enterococcus innesii]|nr:ABC transporter ATP-binding protein [Enterococcus innesii]